MVLYEAFDNPIIEGPLGCGALVAPSGLQNREAGVRILSPQPTDRRFAKARSRRMVFRMLGRDHALLGGLGFLVVAPMILHNPSWQELGVGCVTSAAFALLPDLDEPGSTVSRKLGPLSRSVSRVTNVVASGHRQATHSLFFVALVLVATRLALLSSITVAIVVTASFLLVFRMLLPRALRYVSLVGVGTLVLTAGSAYWAYHLASATAGVAAPSADWLLLATAGGCAWHLVGDAMTVEGIPLFFVPGVESFKHFRIAIPIVGHTGSARESLLGSIMGVALLWMAYVLILTPARHSLVTTSWQFPNLNPFAYIHVHLPNIAHLVQQIKSHVTPPKSH
jgi:membrane-bound metal-dependent hydrolase YbcI (DUF457 family)